MTSLSTNPAAYDAAVYQRDVVEINDQMLITAISDGDSHALEQLYDRYVKHVYQRGLRMLGTPELAEDLVQEVFWRVWQHSKSFTGERGQVAQWLSGIARNVCIDELRRGRARPKIVYEEATHEIMMAQIDDRSDIPATVWMGEERQMILDALQQLPDAQRQAIMLAYFNGLSCQQIANQFDRPLGTIKTRVRLGLSKLSRLLISLQPQTNDEW
jgi:RNA polymerase sigma-70 factor (ECF subfamily)